MSLITQFVALPVVGNGDDRYVRYVNMIDIVAFWKNLYIKDRTVMQVRNTEFVLDVLLPVEEVLDLIKREQMSVFTLLVPQENSIES